MTFQETISVIFLVGFTTPAEKHFPTPSKIHKFTSELI